MEERMNRNNERIPRCLRRGASIRQRRTRDEIDQTTNMSRFQERPLNLILGIVLVVVALVTGCAGVAPKATDTAEQGVKGLLTILETKNPGLNTFKGVGTVTYKERGLFQKGRVAWMGACPDKIRIAALAPSGQPLASLASDGTRLYMLSHPDSRFYQERAGKVLTDFLSVPVKTSDMISLFCGRVPVFPHHSSRLVPNPEGNGWLLELRSGWGGSIEKIYVDQNKETVLKIESVDPLGLLLFQAEWGRFEEISGFFCPFWILLSDREGPVFELNVERLWVNPPVNPESFVLRPEKMG